MKKRSLALGILLGIAVVVSLGIVYIDTTQNYWYVNDGFVKLIVSNQTAQATITIDTNTLAFGLNTNNVNRSIVLKGRAAAVNATGNGENRFTAGAVQWIGGDGGDTTANNANGGVAGASTVVGGTGGNSTGSKTNAAGGDGGNAIVEGGAGGTPTAQATNSLTGGNGGTAVLSGGSPGQPSFAATNVVGGNGGGVQANAANGVTPSVGWIRKPGNGGDVIFTAGNPGSSAIRTNGASGGLVSFTAGNAGNASATGGLLANAGAPGSVNFTAGNGNNGSNGGTNSNGGSVFAIGGSPGTGATAGDVVLARNSSGTARGGVQVGPIVAGAIATLTNVLFVRTNLDFPSTLAQTDFDIPVLALTGRTNAIVSVGPPTPALLAGSAWSGFCSNGLVFVRFSVYGLAAKDPGVGDFEVEIKLYR